jgi:cysteinyl-tRNA synthetase
VVQFIRKLESDGVAYATPSGVYFDTQRFSASHSFKMAPAFEDGVEGARTWTCEALLSHSLTGTLALW